MGLVISELGFVLTLVGLGLCLMGVSAVLMASAVLVHMRTEETAPSVQASGRTSSSATTGGTARTPTPDRKDHPEVVPPQPVVEGPATEPSVSSLPKPLEENLGNAFPELHTEDTHPMESGSIFDDDDADEQAMTEVFSRRPGQALFADEDTGDLDSANDKTEVFTADLLSSLDLDEGILDEDELTGPDNV